ncbi:hypothetical protein ANANG_G00297170 [Anguilla anguilla]|uniref:Ectonucleotide pyrophosphatase/phosphodiesterase 7 n=1 Tax=Anguilla anguilla TaxID=7936 RepID=A0A9D3RK32_ANGAN|nr:hypothetical protein ANANG_G00297170 [Anguilla anguilla]
MEAGKVTRDKTSQTGITIAYRSTGESSLNCRLSITRQNRRNTAPRTSKGNLLTSQAMLWTGCLCLLMVSLCGGAPLKGATRSRNKLLLISFDGFRWDYDRDVDTPNLDAMARDGVKAAYVTPPFITITSPTHFTLLTGRYVENHGVIHNMWFNTSSQEKKPYYMTQFVNEWWDNGSLPIWITAQRQRRAMVRQVDRTVGYIRAAARRHGLAERLDVIITADHGMRAVLRDGLVQEIVLSRIPGFSFQDLSFHLVDFGPVGMLLPKEGRLEKVYSALQGGHPHLHVYKREDMPSRLHYAKNARILPLLLIADPGYVINGFATLQFNKGEHGFDNEDMDMKPFFRAVGPSFRRNLEVGPFETVNVYPHVPCATWNPGHPPMLAQPPPAHLQVEPTRAGAGESAVLPSVVTGLLAVLGFLAIVFLATVSHSACRRRRASQSVQQKKMAFEEKEPDTKQTAM